MVGRGSAGQGEQLGGCSCCPGGGGRTVAGTRDGTERGERRAWDQGYILIRNGQGLLVGWMG